MLNTDLIIMAMGYPEYWAPSRAFSCKWASSEAFFLTGRHHSNHIKNTYHLEWRNASKTKWTSQVGTELSKRCITKHMVIQTKAMILLRNKSRKRRRHNSYIAHAGQNKTESHRNRITYQTYQTDHEPSWSWPLSGVFSCKRASSGTFFHAWALSEVFSRRLVLSKAFSLPGFPHNITQIKQTCRIGTKEDISNVV